MNRASQVFYRYTLIVMLAATRILSRAHYDLPSKWFYLLNSLQASSGMLHERLAEIDDEVQAEFLYMEEMLERRIGRKKFYSEDELRELENRMNDIRL